MKQMRIVTKRLWLVIVLTLAYTSFLSACASNTDVTATEDVKITLMTNPKHPITGDGQLIIYLTRSNGQTIDDAKVSVSVDASGMKTETQEGMAIEQSHGFYVYPIKFHMRTTYDVQLWIYRKGVVIAIHESTIVV